jgi:hypothetical protein
MTFPGLVKANNLSDIGDKEKAWDNLGENISFGEFNSDPYFDQISLLLRGDGANGSTSIIDSSLSPKTATAVGNAQISTAQSKFGGASLLFDGSGDALRYAINEAFGWGTGDFTVEFWLYYLGGNGYVFFWIQGAPVTLPFLGYGLNAGTKTPWLWNGADVLIGNTNVTNNVWQHHAVVRNSGTLTIYLNGISIGSTTFTSNLASSKPFSLGDNGSLLQFTNGYIDDFRITKGVARYTSNFTPPTAPFPNVYPASDTVKGRDILALNNVRAVSPRDFILIKGLSAPVQPRLNGATQNTASGVALSNALLLKQSPSSIGAYSILNGTLDAQQLKINGIQASSLSSSPFSGSAALFPLSITTMELSSNFRLVPLFSSGTIASPTIGMPIETGEFFLYAKTGQS